jgi:NitT/TauT family transport system substrate-binding protein
MSTFRITPHGRLQEWIAHENGFFTDEGLDYEFVWGTSAVKDEVQPAVRAADGDPLDVRKGAFESMETGRACEVSSACHWMVNMAASADHGRMWGHAYTVTQCGIFVAADSPIRTPEDLAGVDIAVGYHSGSHFSTLQALEGILPADNISLRFGGLPLDRLALLLNREVPAANLFGIPYYIAEQQGFRRVLDATFMIGFLATGDSTIEDLEKYFRGMRRAQIEIDLAPERYKHYFLKEMPERYHGMVDVRGFGTGERVVFEPYTREMYERTHRWTANLQILGADQLGDRDYNEAVLV